MLQKTRCDNGCDMVEEIGEGICKRCKNAKEVDVPSAKEMEEALIKSFEEVRPKVLAKIDSLEAGDKLKVMSYVGAETRVRGIHPLTREGRAASIALFMEALLLFGHSITQEEGETNA